MTTYTLVLLRHGQSEWNLKNLFTGWVDVDLTDQGRSEARSAGQLMREETLNFDVLHTSLLRRAINTAHLALDEMNLGWINVKRSWRLNERHYGALQGLDKKETTEKHGEAQVKLWRRSYDVPPPSLSLDDQQHPRFDPRYANLAPDLLPHAECLQDTVQRMLPYWYDAIVPDMIAHKRVLVVAHGNSLRALVKHLDGMSNEAIVGLNIPTGIPLVYELDAALKPLRSRYLGDPEAASKAAAAVAQQASSAS